MISSEIKLKKICDVLSSKDTGDPLILLKTNFERWNHKDDVKKFELEEVMPKRVRELF